MEELLECPICNETDETPKLLPCAHSMCEQCLQQILLAARKERRANLRTIYCPLCRHKVRLPVGGVNDLPTNITLVRMRDLIAAKKENEKKCVPCKDNAGLSQKAHKYCMDCEMNMCETCAAEHITRKLFINHKVVTSTDILCNKHGKAFSYICQTCKHNLCASCIHSGVCEHHTIQKLGAEVLKKSETLDFMRNKILEAIEYNKKELLPIRMTVESKLMDCRTEKIKVKNHGSKLRDCLIKREREMVAMMEKREVELQQIQDKLVSEDQTETLQNLLQVADTAKNEESDTSLHFIKVSLKNIQSQKPLSCNEKYTLSIDIKIELEENLNIGQVLNKRSNANLKSNWSIEGLHSAVDVCIVNNGKIAITDSGDQSVLLIDVDGNQLASSKLVADRGFDFKKPFGIVYHPSEDAIVVADPGAGKLVFLNPDNLELKSCRAIPNIERPSGIAVMSDGSLVIHDSGDDAKICIYNLETLSLTVSSRTYIVDGNEEHFHQLCGISVDVNDSILVADVDNILVFGKYGSFQKYNIASVLYIWKALQTSTGILAVESDTRIDNLPGNLILYNEQTNTTTNLLSWNKDDELKYGCMCSLVTSGDNYIILGTRGVSCYTLTLTCDYTDKCIVIA